MMLANRPVEKSALVPTCTRMIKPRRGRVQRHADRKKEKKETASELELYPALSQ